MNDFWEHMFRQIGCMWQFEPAESAIFACRCFADHGLNKILIPGVGYGRNARIFVENGFELNGIEISETAIALARESGLSFRIHHGSVVDMPFDEEVYDGIFCYALLHLLNRKDRRKFLSDCYNQVREDGLMIFTVVSKAYAKLYGNGRFISKDRFRIQSGLDVFFYDADSLVKEFGQFGMIEFVEIEEPVKHMPAEEPMKFWRVTCQKTPSQSHSPLVQE